MHSHPKQRKVGLEAMGLWLVCGTYCTDYLTDGLVRGLLAARYAAGVEAHRGRVLDGCRGGQGEGEGTESGMAAEEPFAQEKAGL